LLSAFVLGGCANYLAPLETEPVRPRTESPHAEVLRALPEPADKVVAAVYRFRDQTGQYKPTNGGSSFSTAVTQGATSILVAALEESGWFIPIEREGLSNLLNERQIIQTTRVQNARPDAPPPSLPPLLFAGVLIEGGIIGYDTNVMTGGMGARYLGMGASGQYRQDQVTVYLRAVSTQTGRVLKTVHTTKTIISQQLDASFFRYVDVNKILEAEAGYTYNEPNVVAVTQAIEEAVVGLVLEGVRDNLWNLADDADLEDEAFVAYDERVAAAQRLDMFGRTVEPRRQPIALSLTGGAQRLNSDYADPLIRPAGSVEIRYGFSPRFELGVGVTGGGLAADRSFERVQGGADAFLRYNVIPRSTVTPFVSVGAGALLLLDSDGDPDRPIVPTLSAGAGFELTATPQTGITLALGHTYALSDVLDDTARGTYHDNVWTLRTGVTFYFR
jgi:curli production assembly/transport component CsgG